MLVLAVVAPAASANESMVTTNEEAAAYAFENLPEGALQNTDASYCVQTVWPTTSSLCIQVAEAPYIYRIVLCESISTLPPGGTTQCYTFQAYRP